MKCPMCESELVWDSEESACDVSPAYEEGGGEIVGYYHCPNCGRSIEIWDCPEEEQPNYPYYD